MAGRLESGLGRLALTTLLGWLISSASALAGPWTSPGKTLAGGKPGVTAVIEQIRFGRHPSFHRTVLDLASGKAGEAHGFLKLHPRYSIEYREFPSRLNIYFEDVYVEPSTKVMSDAQLPFELISDRSGKVVKLTLFLPGPSEFRVIEVDDPAKLAIDIRPATETGEQKKIYAIQVYGFASLDDALRVFSSGQLDRRMFDLFVVEGTPLIEAALTDYQLASKLALQIEDELPGVKVVVSERRADSLPVI